MNDHEIDVFTMDWSERADDTSWTEHARGFIVDGDGNVCRASGTMTDNVIESADSIPLQTHTLKEFEQASLRPCVLEMSNTYRTLSQHLNDLKKENFSLKLRIYFLEERIQQKFEDSSDDVYRTVSETSDIIIITHRCSSSSGLA
ncbi:Myomegalin Phosphodiesterase 4D-interacting protein [Triplophysa tibetana]|uniref:Myomegalin Phosphodiesterase 4D-interacting protein n=1 Tax=Triplophysa tibetana TaxID=1572043 RepID=A0A5A9PCN0_9TELE|nr:Myomegalin Phosphodiesterase 4D-interacting protein [Triplophysa tibetana]